MKEFLYKILGENYTWLATNYRQVQTYCYSVLHPYHYDAKRYAGTFLENPCEFAYSEELIKHVDRKIYIFWTGDNEITPNRLEAIKSIERMSGVEVRLITPKNLPNYIKEEDPLPEAYEHLSFVHKADYLRTYFMYHYGGGYTDIKTAHSSWVNAFDKLERSKAYAIGYPEIGFIGVAYDGIDNNELKTDLRNHWRYLIGNCAYICRPKTPFTAEWYSETKKRVVGFTNQLRTHPATDPFGLNPDYPVPWVKILGEVFHPLCLKFHQKLLKDNSLMPLFENYR